MRRTRGATLFLLVFAAATLLVAGGLSYLASPHPDGLDSTTLRGCEVVDSPGGQVLEGSCVAQHAAEHPLADLPLADYTVGGDDSLTGVSGVLGAVVVFAAATALFRLAGRRRPGT